jgi:2,3-bisphosphoglycerate-dependent phosphoglycerate mutase
MRVYLIRHGETDYNRERRMQGHGEVPLNDTGIAQVTRLAQRLAGESIDHIYSSDLRRTVMTASIIASHTGAPLTYDAGFRERDPGELTGGTYEAGIGFFADPDFIPPGGESVSIFETRVRAVFNDLAEREHGRGRRVAVVSHGMVCLAFLQLFVPKALEGIDEFASRNASVSILEYDGEWHAESVLDVSHLDGIDLLSTRDSGA